MIHFLSGALASRITADSFLYIAFFLIVGAVWGLITASVVEKRGSDEKWFWWGFFFGPLACAVASLTFRPETDLDRAKTVLAYKELYDEGLISREVFEEKISIINRKKNAVNHSKSSRKKL